MIKALTFDLFGTVFDWRGTIVRRWSHLNPSLNWDAIATRWAGKYAEATRKPWQYLDCILMETGLEIIQEYGLNARLNDNDHYQFTDTWRQLEPFPDSGLALNSLRRQGYRLVALSNANNSLVHVLSHNGRLQFDDIVGNELVRAFKPDLRVYQTAQSRLGLEPNQIMMVASHLFDLEAAKKAGFQTAYVYRHREEKGNAAAAPYVDIRASSLYDLAENINRTA